ncbi:hypothetical protein ACEPAI_2333 [Sanghuangporus weigelae]
MRAIPLALGILAVFQAYLESASAQQASDPSGTASIDASSSLESAPISAPSMSVATGTVSTAAPDSSSSVTSFTSFSSSSLSSAETTFYTTVGSTGASLPLSSTVPGNASSTVSGSFTPGSTASGTGLGGIAVQPTPDPAETHPFTPFPSPTQLSVPGLFPDTDPLSPPGVFSGPKIIPDFNPAWSTSWDRAEALISGLSIEEKVNFTTGSGWMTGRCVGNVPPVPLDGSGPWQGLCLQDGPLGARTVDFATVFPAGINAAATWQRDLIRKRGRALGKEFRGKGVHVALGPMMNLGRVPQGGRNWEGFGADPYLAGEAAYETILGMQSTGVQACAKHYVDNEQEHARMTGSSNVDDRSQHEIYAHPFLKSVMAGVASVLCSYNRINGTYACENDRMLNEVLKGEFGFRGYVMSDWGGQHSTLSAIFGLDMTMPGNIDFETPASYWGANLTAFVNNGSVAEARLDDMATRIAAAWYFVHQDEDYPVVNFNAFDPVDEATNEHVDVQDDHHIIVREVGAASTVLLKNVNKSLPLGKPRSVTLFGLDGGPSPSGLSRFLYNTGNDGILASGWGSGTANFTYLISPLEAIQLRARKDRTTINWFFDNYDLLTAGNMAIQTDVAMVFVNSDSGEAVGIVDGNDGDRKNLTAWHNGDALVAAVAEQNNNTIVVVHSVGPLIIEPWIEHPNVTAVVWAGLGGTETGNALVDVLYGDVNPSGRLPYTIAKNISDYGAQLVLGGSDDSILQIPYEDKLLIDYRHFDANRIEPRFEFGFGLSYTTFEYSNLYISEITSGFASQSLRSAWKKGEPTPSGEGSSAALWLHEPAYEVTFTIQNTGDAAGTEIPQLYVHHPDSAGEPPRVLKGFSDVLLEPGQSETVTITLSRYDLSVWDVVTQSWRRPIGTIRLSVGASSRDLRLKGAFP